MRLRRDRINTGGTVGSTITVQNRTDTAIVDPRCLLGGYSSGVIPAAEPRALLEFSTLVDCAGAFTYPPGFSETSDGPRFSARTSYGVELAAGDHLASIEFEGRRDRVAAPLLLE